MRVFHTLPVRMFRALMVVITFLLLTFSAHATTFTFNYLSWNTFGYGEFSGTEYQAGKLALTDGYINDSKFGRFELAGGNSFTHYLVSQNNAFHYNNTINIEQEPVLDLFGLLFVDDHNRQLNLWGFEFSLWGINILPLYTICIYETDKYIWSSFIDFDVRQTMTATAPVPEPSTALLFGAGILLLARVRRT